MLNTLKKNVHLICIPPGKLPRDEMGKGKKKSKTSICIARLVYRHL